MGLAATRSTIGCEQAILNRIRRARLFVFLCHQHHALVSEAFQQELATLQQDVPHGRLPMPPAELGLALILQAYTERDAPG
jgi:transposase